MPVQQVLVGCISSNKDKKYRKVGKVTTRKIKYGPTKTVTERANNYYTRKNQKITYKATKTVKTVKATNSLQNTPNVEQQPVVVLCNSPSSATCTNSSCPSTSTCSTSC